jgi:pilus assembly protein Flp/PilA
VSSTGCNFKREFVMRKCLSRFLADDSGATAIEYGLIAVGVAIAIVSAVNAVGGALAARFTAVAAAVSP